MSDIRVPARCDNCGQVDDHPKMHYPPRTYHHDCIPAYVMDDVLSDTQHAPDGAGGWQVVARRRLEEHELHPNHMRLLQIIDTAKGGTRGEELLAYIHTLPQED